jgi:Uma2 family endonuclease
MIETQIKYPVTPFFLPDEGDKEETFIRFCRQNPDLRIERYADQSILVMAPTLPETGHYNFELATEISLWNRKHRLGLGFDSSAGFHLPDGSILSPDVSWISHERWNGLTDEDKTGFTQITPDFVLELRSGNQSMAFLKQKMELYIENGCRMAWLVDPKKRKTHVFKAGQEVQIIPFNQSLSGDDVLPGFSMVMDEIFLKK